MSLHSYPSLISDSSSASTAPSDPLQDLPHKPTSQPTFSRASSPAIIVSPKHPENSEIRQLRTRVSKLEQDKFLLEDYATELQSRIRQLEQERISHRDMTNEQLDRTSERMGTRLPRMAISSPSDPKLPPNSLQPKRTPLHRPSNSFSAAPSPPAKRALVPRASPGPSHTTKSKLVPKRGVRVDITETVSSVQEVPVGTSHSQFNNMTPTRRRLQAMVGRFSPETVPTPTTCDIPRHDTNVTNQDSKFGSQSLRVTKSKSLSPDVHLTKQATFTSKLDSIVLTSKLFPLPSSRTKASLATVYPETHSTPTSIAQANAICLDSPPSKNARTVPPRKYSDHLPKAYGIDVNEKSEEKDENLDCRPSLKSRGHVSFSDRLFSSMSAHVEDVDAESDISGKIWGSWSKKKPPQPLVLPRENRPGSPSRVLVPVNSVRFTKSESIAGVDDIRKSKRRSLTPQCLRSLITSSTQAAAGTHEEHINSSRSRSRSRDPVILDDSVGRTSKEGKRRINPLRVGSPSIPKGRLPELQTGTGLQRTSSMRSTGKWGQRGKGFSSEFTRGRTVHPMFSFERQGSSEATSTTSSKETIEIRHTDAGPSKSSKKARVVARDNVDTPCPNASSSQENSTTGRTIMTGNMRSDPGSAFKMMRTRGAQAHGTFAFEPAAAVVIPLRAAPRVGGHNSATASEPSGSLSKITGVPARSYGSPKGHVKSRSESKVQTIESHSERKIREYAEFCEELKVILGDGADWTSFMNYVRRFDLHVLSADVLLQRVKKLIDGHRSVDGTTRTRLYERFAKIVHDSDNLYG